MPDKDELDYRSTESSILAPYAPATQDIADKGAIKRSLALLENRIVFYDSVDSLGTDEKAIGFTIKQQLAINKKVKFHLTEIQAELMEAIESLGA
jgi:hypothetical protein